jgi:hypothetical protein
MDLIFAAASTIFAFILVGWLYFWLPMTMAETRGRSSVGWVVLTIVFSPVVSIVALLVLGPTVELALKKIRENEDLDHASRDQTDDPSVN